MELEQAVLPSNFRKQCQKACSCKSNLELTLWKDPKQDLRIQILNFCVLDFRIFVLLDVFVACCSQTTEVAALSTPSSLHGHICSWKVVVLPLPLPGCNTALHPTPASWAPAGVSLEPVFAVAKWDHKETAHPPKWPDMVHPESPKWGNCFN